MTQEEKKLEIDKKITEKYDRMVSDSRRIASFNYDQYGQDLLAHCLSEFLEKKPIDYQYQVAVVDNKLPNYMGRSMSMAIKSNTSTFWHRYRKEQYKYRGVYLAEGKEDDTFSIEYNMQPDKDKSPLDCIHWVIENELDWYEGTIIDKIYLQKWSKKQFMSTYGLPLNSFNKDFKQTIKKFRKLCSHFM